MELCFTNSLMRIGAGNAQANKGGGMAHAHIGHVMTGWSDTPEGMGPQPPAIAEAENAIQHAGFAA